MGKVCVFGSVAADIVLHVRMLPRAGDHISATALGWRPGGASANLACALSSAGHAVDFIGAVGDDDLGRTLRRELTERGINTDFLSLDGRSPRALILVDGEGERTILDIGVGMNAHRQAENAWPNIDDADVVYVENFAVLPESLRKSLPQCQALIAAPPPAGDRSSYGSVDMMLGSEFEYPADWQSAPFTRATCAADHRLSWVVVTKGGRGAVAYGRRGKLVAVQGTPVEQVDATGAGDAFAAGTLHGLLEGLNLRAAMELGARWGASAAQVSQSVPPNWEDLFGLMT